MSKQTIQYAIFGIAILLLAYYLVMFIAGFNQDRPGNYYAADPDRPKISFDMHAPENRDHRINHLISLVKGSDIGKARLASITLGNMGADAEPALENLKAFKDHPVDAVREEIIKAIDKIEADVAKHKAEGDES